MKRISLLLAVLYSGAALADLTTIVHLNSGSVSVTNTVSGKSIQLVPGQTISAGSNGSLAPFKGAIPSTDTSSSSGSGKSASNGNKQSSGGSQGKSSGGSSSQSSSNGSSQSNSSGSSGNSGSSSQSASNGSSGGESSSASNESSNGSTGSSGGSQSASTGSSGGGTSSSGSASGGSGSVSSATNITSSDTGGSSPPTESNGGGTTLTTTTVQSSTTATTPTTSSTPSTSTIPQQVVTLQGSGGTTVNATSNTVTSSTGQTTTIQQGVYGSLARSAATSAQAAAGTTDFSLSMSTSSISSSITSASNAISSATSAKSTGNSAVTQANAAQTAFASNGTFADSSAVTADYAITSANTAIQSALATVNAALSTANASLISANTNLNAANTQISTVGTYQTAISSNQATIAGNATAMQTLTAAGLTTASVPTTLQQAVNVASVAASQAAALQAAGDVTDAQAALATAQAALSLVNAALSANSAATAASSAATAASTAISNVSAQISTISSNAATVSANAPVAAYNNPAVAGNFIGHFMMPVAATGGYNFGEAPSNPAQINTNFVLDGSGNLIEVRSMGFQVTDLTTATAVTTPISSADIKWSGGTAADTFKLADNSVYGGRWVNPVVTVTDTSTSAVTTYNPANSLWAVLLAPPANYVQSLTGTVTYNLAGNTTPFDAAGVLGTLNSATFSANFTNQTVDASVNLTMGSGTMAGTYALTGTAMPIQSATSINPAGFGNGTQTVICTGTCAAGTSGYSTNLGGSFAGNTASSAGLAYNVWPATSGSPASDMVQGLIAFTAPTVATTLAAYTPNLVAYTISDPTYHGAFAAVFYNNVGIVPSSNITYTGGSPTSVVDNTYSCYGCNGSLTQTILGAASPVAGNANSYATTGIQFGRWTVSTGAQSIYSVPLGSQWGAPSSWIYGPQGYLDSAIVAGVSTGPLVGTFAYALDGSNAPVNTNSGAAGTLTSASLTANFTNQTVSASLGLTMGTTAWTANATNLSISNGQFNAYAVSGGTANTLTVNQNGVACSSCGGNLNGAFTGQNYAGAILSYNLFDGSYASYIEGNAAFTRNYAGNTNPAVTNGTAAPTGQYWVADYGGSLLLASSVTRNSNVLAAYSMPSTTTTSGITSAITANVFCSNCTGNASGDVTNTGIFYGTWDSGIYSSTSMMNWTSAPGQYHWITGPEVGPVYLAQVLTGTMNFALDGGTSPTNQSGIAGTLNSGSLVVNFAKQTVGISLGLTDNGHTWSVSTPVGNEAPLSGVNGIGNTAFYAYASGAAALASTPGMVNVTVDGASNYASGNISGQLTGTGITGAMLNYNLSGTVSSGTESVNGVAAFVAASASNTSASYQFVGASATDAINTSTVVTTTAGGIGAAFDASSRIASSAGSLTAFDVNPIGSSGNGSYTLGINTSTPTDTGTDTLTGISWGRWQGGTVNVTDRATGIVTPVTLASSLHWISGPVATSPVTLPTSGAFAYTLAGGTHPTDNLGNIGTLNSATLTANFTAQTVDVGVNVTVNGSNMIAQATGAPIIQKTAFSADTSIPVGTPGNLSVTCTGTCGASTSGKIAGAFSGAGGTGAGIMYAMQRLGGATPGSISGVAAFHR